MLVTDGTALQHFEHHEVYVRSDFLNWTPLVGPRGLGFNV